MTRNPADAFSHVWSRQQLHKLLFALLVGGTSLVGGPRLSARAQTLSGQKWLDMDYGPYLTATVEAPRPHGNLAYKGLVIRLGGDPEANVLFDTDLLRFAAGWTGGLIDFRNVAFDGSHGTHSSIVGRQHFGSSMQPGWAHQGRFDDPRELPYGPLPHEWARYQGLYLHGRQVVLMYTVGGTRVRESPLRKTLAGQTFFARVIEIGESDEDLVLEVCSEPGFVSELVPIDATAETGQRASATGSMAMLARPAGPIGAQDAEQRQSGDATGRRVDDGAAPHRIVAACAGAPAGLRWQLDEPSHIRLRIAAAATPVRFTLLVGSLLPEKLERMAQSIRALGAPEPLDALVHGGPARYPTVLRTQGELGDDHAPHAIDTISAPMENPWNAWMRFGGFDFFPGAKRAAVCTWNGDVWIVDGLNDSLDALRWRRFATGLFQPLGVKIVAGQIYGCGRDQITRLHDLNRDGEADFYECFNNDHQVTEHFHEFAMDLQLGPDGDFYYTKAARHALDAVVPQHGTVLRVSRDGSRTEIVAHGFRAPNGLGIGPNGKVVVSDQQGHWTPANRINLVKPGGFYGYMWSYHRGETPAQYDPPICWLPQDVDRSPAEQLWVNSDRWGLPRGGLISLSYGTGQIFLVMHEEVEGVPQGGVFRLPLEFPTGIMRGRFSPSDGQLYVCGLFGWSSNKTLDGGLYRVRYTGRPTHMPIGLRAVRSGLALTFTTELEPTAANDADSYYLERWNYRWHEQYGSDHYRVSAPHVQGHDEVPLRAATLLPDKRTVFLHIDDLAPVMQMRIAYRLRAADGTPLRHEIHNTINALGRPDDEFAVTARRSPAIAAVPPRRAPEHLQKGVVVTFRSRAPGDHAFDARRARLCALHVPAGAAPTPFLPAGPFTARARGFLKVELKGAYRFHVRGRGAVVVRINGVQALKGDAADPDDGMPAPVLLERGYNALEVDYASPAEGDAAFRLEWSSDEFSAEPIPPAVLFCNDDDPSLVTGERLRRGRELYATHGCHQCHGPLVPTARHQNAVMPELLHAPPALDAVGDRLNADWIARWILQPHRFRRNARMPRLFVPADSPSSRQNAAAIASYLSSLRGSGSLGPTTQGSETLVETGETLYENLGCIGCHTFEPSGATDRWDRVSLHYVSAKFLPGALVRFLSDPHRYHPSSRMPDFALSSEEATALAAYLRASSPGVVEPLPELSQADPDRGERLFAQLGCANCHELKAHDATDQPPKGNPLAAISANRRRNWLPTHHPYYDFTEAERQALEAFLDTDGRSLRRRVPVEFARRQYRVLACATCHSRDGEPARLPQVVAQEGVLGLVPERVPELTLAGEKLRTSWMRCLLAGELPLRSRPWLRMRMPGVAARADVLAEGLAAAHGFGRTSQRHRPNDPALVNVGRRLVGKAEGFTCIQCHAIGEQPAEAAFETPGINLGMVVSRLRFDYYRRWMLDPTRIDPAAKMPKLASNGGATPLRHVFGGDAVRQFDAIWHYLQTLDE